jgi:mannose/cellobiose epimerase-like protein (N-acyl-D-glucosamine 2-epimerase family)
VRAARTHPLRKQSAGGWNVLGLLHEARGLHDASYRCFTQALALLPPMPKAGSAAKQQQQQLGQKAFRTVIPLSESSGTHPLLSSL